MLNVITIIANPKDIELEDYSHIIALNGKPASMMEIQRAVEGSEYIEIEDVLVPSTRAIRMLEDLFVDGFTNSIGFPLYTLNASFVNGAVEIPEDTPSIFAFLDSVYKEPIGSRWVLHKDVYIKLEDFPSNDNDILMNKWSVINMIHAINIDPSFPDYLTDEEFLKIHLNHTVSSGSESESCEELPF